MRPAALAVVSAVLLCTVACGGDPRSFFLGKYSGTVTLDQPGQPSKVTSGTMNVNRALDTAKILMVASDCTVAASVAIDDSLTIDPTDCPIAPAAGCTRESMSIANGSGGKRGGVLTTSWSGSIVATCSPPVNPLAFTLTLAMTQL